MYSAGDNLAKCYMGVDTPDDSKCPQPVDIGTRDQFMTNYCAEDNRIFAGNTACDKWWELDTEKKGFQDIAAVDWCSLPQNKDHDYCSCINAGVDWRANQRCKDKNGYVTATMDPDRNSKYGPPVAPTPKPEAKTDSETEPMTLFGMNIVYVVMIFICFIVFCYVAYQQLGSKDGISLEHIHRGHHR